MQTTHHWNQLLAPYQPQLPLADLIVEVNKLFHQFEADAYDRRHPEIFQQGAKLWQEMTTAALPQGQARTWRVLDFGCGTGFASMQLLARVPREQIERLVCYDLSPQMVEHCREKVGPMIPQATFCHQWEQLAAAGPFNLLLTNGLLHHLPDPLAVIQQIEQCLDRDALWLSGQEPSSRFYKNAACRAHYESFQSQRNRRRIFGWRRWLSAERLKEKLNKLVGQTSSPKTRTAQAAYENGLFKQLPTPKLIDRLVDFHVAHDAMEAEAGRGFDYQDLKARLEPHWRLVWFKSYSYMGPQYEPRLPQSWQRACRSLADQHPLDGANFCSAWQRACS